ncbi:MAG: tRNA G18 (ribose-2'-O)-methylase SpoU [Sediminicola sp.]|jgi:tRNA G18 (ribose-2'-O)-methylase SpoU|tara:strand:+ start:1751 stop:2257 length:507 start_codon:yes stop_codon:yes gene_type:complete
MAFQHSHTTTPFSKNKFPLIVLCDGLNSPANIGGLFRVCEAFGVAQILFFNGSIDINSSRLKRTARETHKSVDYAICDDINTTVKAFIKKGYEIIALEISDISIPSESITLDKNAIVLVIGNERLGVSEEILALTSKHMHIEMYGKNSSMNVVQATGIALYTLINKLK